MADIEKVKNNTVEGLGEEGKTILDYAYNQLKNGEITRLIYLEIVNGLEKWNNNPYEEITAEDAGFMDYLLKSSPWMGGEAGVSVFGELLQRYGGRKIASGTEQLRRMTTVGDKRSCLWDNGSVNGADPQCLELALPSVFTMM